MTLDPAAINPPAVEGEIVRLSNLLDRATSETAKRARARAKSRRAFKTAYAKAYLLAGQDRPEGSKPPPIPEREAKAVLATEVEELEFEEADALVEAAKEAGRNLREQIAAMRTLAANLRAVVS